MTFAEWQPLWIEQLERLGTFCESLDSEEMHRLGDVQSRISFLTSFATLLAICRFEQECLSLFDALPGLPLALLQTARSIDGCEGALHEVGELPEAPTVRPYYVLSMVVLNGLRKL